VVEERQITAEDEIPARGKRNTLVKLLWRNFTYS